jgi:hypothetical protein
MKVTKSQLRQIIKEELETTILNEGYEDTSDEPTVSTASNIALPEAKAIAQDPVLIEQLFQLVPQVVSWVTGHNMAGMNKFSLEQLYGRVKKAQ